MSILIKDNLKRLVKNPILWVFTAIEALITIVYTYLVTHNMIHKGYVPKLETVMFSGIAYEMIPVLGFMIIILGISFIGSDYSAGNIKKKIIVGYSKESVYLSNFITLLIGAAIILTARLIVFCLVALPSIREIDYRSSYLLAATTVVALSTVFYCAFATFLVTVCKSAKGSFVRFILFYLFLIIILIMLVNMMPQTYEPDYAKYSVLTGFEDYSKYTLPTDAAPKQLRDLTKVIYDALPMMQLSQISPESAFSPLCLWAIIPFSVVEILAFFFAGFFVAKKQNLN